MPLGANRKIRNARLSALRITTVCCSEIYLTALKSKIAWINP